MDRRQSSAGLAEASGHGKEAPGLMAPRFEQNSIERTR